MHRFVRLVLVFIGVKMLLYDVVHMPVWVSLAVIGAVAGGAIGASLWHDRRLRRLREEHQHEDVQHEDVQHEEFQHEHDSLHAAAEPRGPVRT